MKTQLVVVLIALLALLLAPVRSWRFEQDLQDSSPNRRTAAHTSSSGSLDSDDSSDDDNTAGFPIALATMVLHDDFKLSFASADRTSITVWTNGISYHNWSPRRFHLPDATVLAVDMTPDAVVVGAVGEAFLISLNDDGTPKHISFPPHFGFESFGAAVSINAEEIAVGIPHDTAMGAVALYHHDITLTQVITAPSFSRPHTRFGSSIAFGIDSLILAIGAPTSKGLVSSQSNAGAVFVYTRKENDTMWELTNVLNNATQHSKSAGFGALVEMSYDGMLMAVGVPCSSTVSSNAVSTNCDEDEVFIYERQSSSSDWELKHRLKADKGDSTATSGDNGLFFGCSLSLDNTERIAVGSAGGFVYIFNAKNGDRLAKIKPATFVGGKYNELNRPLFGSSVSINNDVLAVGNPSASTTEGENDGVIKMYSVAEPPEWQVAVVLGSALVILALCVQFIIACDRYSPAVSALHVPPTMTPNTPNIS